MEGDTYMLLAVSPVALVLVPVGVDHATAAVPVVVPPLSCEEKRRPAEQPWLGLREQAEMLSIPS
jgi:hypothetical protein